MKNEWSENEKIEKSLKLSIFQSSLDSASDSFGKNNISAFMLAFGATSTQIAFIEGVSKLAISFFELASSKLIDSFSRKTLSILFVSLKAFLYLVFAALAGLSWLGYGSLPVLMVCIVVFFICIGLSYPAYFSLIGSLVPDTVRGRFFSRKKFWFLTIGTITTVIAATFLDFFKMESSVMIGFLLLFFFAFIARGTSGALYAKIYEPKYRKQDEMPLVEKIKMLRKNGNINFIVFQGLAAFASAFAGPYIVVYLLEDLQLSYFFYLTILYAPTFFQIVILRYVGVFFDRIQNAVLLKISYFTMSLVALGFFVSYFVPSHALQIAFLIFINGIAGGSASVLNDISARNYLLETSQDNQRAYLISYEHIFSSILFFAGIGISIFILHSEYGFANQLVPLFFISFILTFSFAVLSVRGIRKPAYRSR